MTVLHAIDRRRFLQAITGLTLGLGMVANASAQEYEPSVTFDDQTTSGDEITVAKIVTNEPVYWRVHAGETDYASGHFDGKQQFENKRIQLQKEIKVSQQVYISLYPEGGGNSVAYDSALITVENDSILGVNEIAKNPDGGFHFPYFLYVPLTEGKWNTNKPILVHQNNSPSTSDDFSYHKEHARSKLNSPSRQISDALGIPLLVPVTPRPHDNQDAQRLQAMGNRALRLEEERLARVDLQVKNMIEDAQEKLAEKSHSVRDEIILNGYSGSGQFAQRFAMLHPEKVISVTAGGMSGVPILPSKEAKNKTLNYYLGIADFEELIGKPSNLEAFKEIDLFYYEGGQDTNDFLLPNDPHRPEIRTIALDIFGENIVEDRVPFARKTYDQEGIPLEYRIYEDNGHEWAPVEDLIAFHEPHVPENEPAVTTTTTAEKSTTTPENGSEVTTTRKQQPNATESGEATKSIKSPTTGSEAPGLSIFSGLTSVIGATYLGSRLLGSSDK